MILLAKDEPVWLERYSEECAALVSTHCVRLLRSREDTPALNSNVHWVHPQSPGLSCQNLLDILSLTSTFENPLVLALSTELSGLPFSSSVQIADLTRLSGDLSAPPSPHEHEFAHMVLASEEPDEAATRSAVQELLRLELTRSAAAALAAVESIADGTVQDHLRVSSLESSLALATWDRHAVRRAATRSQETASAQSQRVAQASHVALLDGLDGPINRLLSLLAGPRSVALRLLRQSPARTWPGSWRVSTALARPLRSRPGKTTMASLKKAMETG